MYEDYGEMGTLVRIAAFASKTITIPNVENVKHDDCKSIVQHYVEFSLVL